jgi:hypothetical protein
MRQHAGQPAALAVVGIVVQRMIVAACRLEGEEHRLRHGAARQRETLADREVLEPALRRDRAVVRRIEARIRVGHAAHPSGPGSPVPVVLS